MSSASQLSTSSHDGVRSRADRINEQARQGVAIDHKKTEIKHKQEQINDMCDGMTIGFLYCKQRMRTVHFLDAHTHGSLRSKKAEFVAALGSVPAVSALTLSCRQKLS
jgi:hypothetical protein